MANNSTWAMGTVTAVSVLVAVGVGFNGVRSNPLPPVRTEAPAPAPSNSPGADPLQPRLFNQAAPIRIHVAGAVKGPGVYCLPQWSRVIDAVKRAGGASASADLDRINLADHLKDGEQLRIPVRGRNEVAETHPPTPEPVPVSDATGGHGLGRYPFTPHEAKPGSGSSLQPVNLNTASKEELDGLPGVGPTTADRIISYRAEHGPFLRAEDVMNVPGIGPSKFEKLRDTLVAE